MFEAVSQLEAEHAELEQRLADPTVHSDQSLARRLNQRYAELSAVVRAHDEWRQLTDDVTAARELAGEDPSFAEEAERLDPRARGRRGAPARPCWCPATRRRKDVLLEIKSGEGGEESALFAGDLLRMYRAGRSGTAGPPRCSTPPSPTWAATRPSRSRSAEGVSEPGASGSG